jgi:hypothetical protein
MYRALLSFSKTIVDPMVYWGFERALSRLELNSISNPVQIDPNRDLARIVVHDFELDELFIDPDQM